MNVVEYLENVKKYDFAVENLLNRKEELRTLALKVTSGDADGMPRGSDVSDKVGNIVSKLVDMESEIDKAIDRYIDYKSGVCASILRLDAVQYQVLYLRYIEYKTHPEIAEKMHYSEKQIYIIKRKALETLQSWLDNEEVMKSNTITML